MQVYFPAPFFIILLCHGLDLPFRIPRPLSPEYLFYSVPGAIYDGSQGLPKAVVVVSLLSKFEPAHLSASTDRWCTI